METTLAIYFKKKKDVINKSLVIGYLLLKSRGGWATTDGIITLYIKGSLLRRLEERLCN